MINACFDGSLSVRFSPNLQTRSAKGIVGAARNGNYMNAKALVSCALEEAQQVALEKVPGGPASLRHAATCCMHMAAVRAASEISTRKCMV